MRPITGILLAAGLSKRFGEKNKLLQPLLDGTPVAIAAAQKLQRITERTLVVLQSNSSELVDNIQSLDVEIVICPQASKGMGNSIACGVQASADSIGWIIALADMPFIQLQTIETVYHALRKGKPIVAPVYQGRRGHPVGFHQQFYSILNQLQGDIGARHLLENQSIYTFVCEDIGIHQDIDYPEDISSI